MNTRPNSPKQYKELYRGLDLCSRKISHLQKTANQSYTIDKLLEAIRTAINVCLSGIEEHEDKAETKKKTNNNTTCPPTEIEWCYTVADKITLTLQQQGGCYSLSSEKGHISNYADLCEAMEAANGMVRYLNMAYSEEAT